MSRNSPNSASPAHHVGVVGAAARFWQRSYAADYVTLGFLTAAWLLVQLIDPFHRMISLDNRAIQYPYATHERVPMPWAIIYAGIIPFAILLAWSAMFRPGVQQTQATVLGLGVSLILTSLLTDLIKNAVGRPRPDLLARCQPARGTADAALVPWTICTQPNHGLLHEGFRSFPSGHSSFSFSGLGYLSLFFCGQMHIFRPRADLGRCLLALTPLFCALMIAISRLDDYRHDVWDVTSGSILGLAVCWFSYRRYYPALASVRCDIPYDKTDFVGADGFGKLDDEEQAQSRPFIPRDGPSDEVYRLQDTGEVREDYSS
ncbi:hypothetical protein NUU61_010082 [Penicillium alfredii]|uniref:Phosphatidic acid phosphatase type 2/haloperoxidase domain-containing protein n=1 Tax=Penicillium alfredii TaxID=1506179 RepID=A0A9W9EHB4_9EURO|nr:uncharacterized protein NUU61_010082 [Penicillium alfredii]KAJ5081818.1 hypothetical protein NUU61_010082 [Penicillium alfredii]